MLSIAKITFPWNRVESKPQAKLSNIRQSGRIIPDCSLQGLSPNTFLPASIWQAEILKFRYESAAHATSLA
jgi:hypothetical protein